MEFSLIYITTKNRDEATALGRMLLEKKLAACVNVIDGMESMYWWEGKIESGHETVLIAKTAREKVEKLTAVVKAVHSYECPCVLELAVTGGNPAYLEWLESSLK